MHAGQTVAVDFYFDSYAEIGLQRFMVSDQARTDAFAAAIREVVKGGERVIDVGTGSGLLAMLAARAGARRVYALDQSTVAKAARRTVERNGMSEVVEVINGNASDFQLTEPVDVIVSEWLGHFAFVEAMLDDVIACRDANLKEDGVMLPSGVELRLAPVKAPLLYEEEGPGFWKRPIHGIDFSHLEEAELEQALAIKTDAPGRELLAAGQRLLRLDLATAGKEDAFQSGELRFVVERDGIFGGFLGWFVAELSPSVILDTGPEHPLTHWKQSYFPMPARRVRKGETLRVTFALERHPAEKRSVLVKLSEGETRFDYTVG